MRTYFFLLLLTLIKCDSTPTNPETTRIKDADGIPVETLIAKDSTLQFEGGEKFIITWLKGLTTDGESVLGWSDTNPAFIASNGVVRNLAGFGEGPGEYGRIAAGHLSPLGVHVIDERNRVTFYQEENYVSDFRIQGPGRVTFPMLSMGVDEFLVTEDFIITPTMVDKIGQLGTIYTHEGDRIGIVTDPEFDESQLRISTWSQRTHWGIHDERIFVLSMYWGWLLELDSQFEIIKRHQLESPLINDYLSNYLNADPSVRPPHKKNLPLFHDFQIYRGRGYASTMDSIHQFDLNTGNVTRIYRLRIAEGEYSDQPFVSLPLFAILNNETMVVGNMILDSLLIVDLPLEITKPQ